MSAIVPGRNIMTAAPSWYAPGPARRTRKPKSIVGWVLLGLLSVLGLTMGVLFVLPYVPIPPDRFTDVSILNDQTTPVGVRQCIHDGPHDCATADRADTLRPGERETVTVATDIGNAYLIINKNTPATCLRLVFHDEEQHTVRTSEATPCPDLGLPRRNGP